MHSQPALRRQEQRLATAMKSARTVNAVFPALCAVIFALPGTSQAEGQLPLLDRISASVGLYDASNDLSGRWDSRSGDVGTDFSFQRDLGFADGERLNFLHAGIGFGRDLQFRFDLFQYRTSDDSRTVLARDIVVAGNVYQVEAAFEGSLETATRGSSLTWFFRRTQASASGLGIALIRYDIDSVLTATARVEDNSISTRYVIDESEWAPVLHGQYIRTFGDRWRFGSTLSFLDATVGNVSGRIVDLQARLEYFPWEHVGFALRYSYNRVELDLARSKHDGRIDLHSRGPQLHAVFRF